MCHFFLHFKKLVLSLSLFLLFLVSSGPDAVSVIVATERSEGAALAPIAVGAHQALTADSVALILTPAHFPRALGAGLVSADVHLPTVAALLDIAHHIMVPGIATNPWVSRHCPNAQAGHYIQGCHDQEDEGRDGGAKGAPPSPTCRC